MYVSYRRLQINIEIRSVAISGGERFPRGGGRAEGEVRGLQDAARHERGAHRVQQPRGHAATTRARRRPHARYTTPDTINVFTFTTLIYR